MFFPAAAIAFAVSLAAFPASATDCDPPAKSTMTSLDVVNYWQDHDPALLFACTQDGRWVQARVIRYSCAGDCAAVIEFADGSKVRGFPAERLFTPQELEGLPEGQLIMDKAQKFGS